MLAAGRLIGILRHHRRGAAMQDLEEVTVVAGAGLEGERRGAKFPKRGITILGIEDWRAAAAAVGAPDLDWRTRRANLLVEGLRLPRARGALLAIGDVRLEVAAQTYPCSRMETAHAGLLKALAPDWRGGVCCKVVTGGALRIGDIVVLLSSPPEPRPPALP